MDIILPLKLQAEIIILTHSLHWLRFFLRHRYIRHFRSLLLQRLFHLGHLRSLLLYYFRHWWLMLFLLHMLDLLFHYWQRWRILTILAAPRLTLTRTAILVGSPILLVATHPRVPAVIPFAVEDKVQAFI